MMPDTTSLANLRDIAVPPPVSWWPLALGWWVVIALTLVFIALYGYRTWQRWKANAYRRAALTELRSATNDATIAEILKRTALCASPRADVASLAGDNWCQWLCATGGADVPVAVAERLSVGIFQDRSKHTSELHDFAARWINNHRIHTTDPSSA